jgi:hypothetical protein
VHTGIQKTQSYTTTLQSPRSPSVEIFTAEVQYLEHQLSPVFTVSYHHP